MLTRFLLFLIFVAPSSSVAQAHPVAQGRLEIDILPNKINARILASTEEVFVERALSSGAQDSNATPEELFQQHVAYLLRHIQVFADDKPVGGSVVLALAPRGPGVQRPSYELEFTLPSPPARIRIEQNVLNEFDYAPGNRWEATYVTRIAQQGRPPTDGLLFTSREPLVINCAWGTPSQTGGPTVAEIDKWRLTKQYVRHGVLHILSGYDHLLFIGALVLGVVTLWDLIKVISVFTLAHSITLTLSVLNVVRLPPKIVEPMIAASIIFVALQNVLSPERSHGAARLAVAFFFGLFHGLGFAGGLLKAMEGMAGLTIGIAIAAFSVGVEAGQQIVILPTFAALKLARMSRSNSLPLANYVVRAGSLAICIAGIFYLVGALR